jgi:hypothetical protein
MSQFTTIEPAHDELTEAQLDAVSGGILDASSLLGDAMICLGGKLINSKMEVNL